MKRILWGLGMAVLCVALAGISQQTANALLDTTPPTGTIIINNNRSATNTPNVTLALTWDDGVGGSGVSRMRFSDNGSTWTVWEPVAAIRAYTLLGPDGYKTLRVQYLDKANNRSAVFTDYIRLDTMAPTGTIIINNNDWSTPSQAVTLGLTWKDETGTGVTRMRFSDNGATWTAWETLKTTRAHALPLPNGYHTVRAQYLDGAGNYSAVYNDYIKLQIPPPVEETVMLPGGVQLVMAWIPGGTFTMGSPTAEQDRYSSEGPQHSVTLSGYWMGKYELTKRQWKAVMGTTPWSGQDYVLADLDSPAVYMSWNDAQSFVTAVNNYTGQTFGLPSEAEWEYACRAGMSTPFYWGYDPTYRLINDYAWWFLNAYDVGQRYAHVVGQKSPNAFGLYDMSGNVWEWCEDDWHDDYTGAPTGGQAWVDAPRGLRRVFRGGGCGGDGGGTCRSAARVSEGPADTIFYSGFRLAK